MKKLPWLLGLILLANLSFADSLNISFSSDSDVFRIRAGQKPEQNVSKHELERRIWELERAVMQLQDRVFELSRKPVHQPEEKKYSCYLTTSFNGTVTGSGKTLNEAKGATLKACGDSGEAFCNESKLRCD